MDYIDLTDPNVRAGMEYLDAHATHSMRQAFLAKHPELLNVEGLADVQNEQTIYGLLGIKKLPPTPENLELCFQEALADGQLTLPMYSNRELQAFEMKGADGKHLMTTAAMAEYLKKTRPGPPPSPPNAAEFLLTRGGRASDTILSRGQK